MDYFKLTNGNSVRVTDMSGEMWTIDMLACGNYASVYDNGLRCIPVSDIAYEINALDMAVYMLESMMQMEWIDSDKVRWAICDLMDRFTDELVFNVDISLGPMCETFTIDIRDLSPYAVTKVVVWNYPIGYLWGYL